VISSNVLTVVIASMPVREGIRMFQGMSEIAPPFLESALFPTCAKFVETPNVSRPATGMELKGTRKGTLS